MSKSQSESTYVMDTIDNLTYSNKESSSKLLAISQTSGIPLFEKKFDSSFKYQGNLLTIGMTALRVFLLDSFERTNINRIRVDDLTVRMVNIDDVIVYYVYTGDQKDNDTKFDKFVERLVTMDCWRRFSQSEYNTFNQDTSSISLMVEEIFAF